MANPAGGDEMNDSREEMVAEILGMIEELEPVVSLLMGEGRPDFRERLSIIRQGLEAATSVDSEIDDLVGRFDVLLMEISRELGLREKAS
jgi:hypothetical protein